MPPDVIDKFVESFSVTCETCSSRLKVRDASIVGEIHACPKCGSMVQVQPPPGWQTAPTASSVSFDPVPEPLAEPPDPQPGVPATPVPEESFTASLPANLDTPVGSIQETQPMRFDELPAPPEPVAVGALPIVWWSLTGVGVLLLGGVASLLLRGEEPSVAVARPVAEAATSDPAETTQETVATTDPYAVNSPAERTEPATSPVATDLDSESPSAELSEPPSAIAELPALPGETRDATGKSADDIQIASAQDAPDSDAGNANAQATNAAEIKSPKPILEFDPLDFDPARLSLGTATSSASVAHSSAGLVGEGASPEVDAESAESEDKPADEILAPPDHDPTLHVRRGPMAAGAAQAIDAATQLGMHIDSLEISDISLARFIDLVSSLAGVPITLDPAALSLAGTSPDAVVAVRARDTSVESMLGDLLSNHRLELVENDSAARIVLRNGDRWRSIDYKADDMTAGDDAPQLAELIEKFVAPSTWQSTGGKGKIKIDGTTLRIEQAQRVHHAILIFCERLRLARGLAPRSRYPAEKLTIDPPHAAIADRLRERTTFTFLPWTRWSELLHHWEEASGLTILVDWSALADEGLLPWSPVAGSAIDRTWADTLDGMLEPLDLAWWAVDGETLQITTREACDEIERIEFYDPSQAWREQFASKKAMIDALREELRQRDDNSVGESDKSRIEFDPPSDRLIVRGPPELHRFLSERLVSAPVGGTP